MRPAGPARAGYYYETLRVPRSATYVRHSHDDDELVEEDDDDDDDVEDYPLFYGRTSPRTSLFQERELHRDRMERSLSRYRLFEERGGILTLLTRVEEVSNVQKTLCT